VTPETEVMARLRTQARAILEEELDEPPEETELQLERIFDKHPFYDALLAAAFSFRLPGKPDRFFVFTGNIMPMIYRDMGLSLDDLWAVHVGMEYYVKTGVTEETDRAPRAMFSYLKMVTALFREQMSLTLTSPPKIEKVYALQDRRQAVGTYAAGETVYSWIVGDVPPFIYRRRLPAQIIWALHMGRLLLTE
jgi:hypothetical protein